jgi:hypothetical protein
VEIAHEVGARIGEGTAIGNSDNPEAAEPEPWGEGRRRALAFGRVARMVWSAFFDRGLHRTAE